MNCLEYFNNITTIVIDISSFKEDKVFKYISSLSEIQKYAYVKIKNLKSNTDYNGKIGKVIEKLENNRYKIYIENKYLSIIKSNLELYPVILYFRPPDVEYKILQYYNYGFNVPLTNNKDHIVIFYKGDYYYEDTKTITKAKLDSFFENSSYETHKICNICNGETLDLIACNKCIYTYCQKCVLKFNDKICPYCKDPLKYTLKI